LDPIVGSELRQLWRLPVAATVAGLLLASAAVGEVSLLGAGLLLPVQNRSEEVEVAAVVEGSMVGELAGRARVLDAKRLRAFLRHLRIRNLADASPQQMERLAAELGVDWFFSPILHEAISGMTPRVTLSASLYAGGELELAWSDFSARSGLEKLPWLGRGRVDDVTELARNVTQEMAQSLLAAPADDPASSSTITALPGRVVVLPFNAVTDRNAAEAAETATQAALAGYHRRRTPLVFPGLVEEVQREVGRIWRGELDDTLREALRQRTGATWIFTGTVEIFEPGTGDQPEPRVALSARLIDVDSDDIAWIGGRDRSGWDRQRLFGAGRIYSSGNLLQEIMESLIDEAIASVAPAGGSG
jgi:hypothetical protein